MADDTGNLPDLPAGTAHRRLDEVVSYRAGDLTPERARAFEEHVERCPACLRLVRDAALVLTEVDHTVRAAESKANPVDLILARLRRTAAERAAGSRDRMPRQPSTRFWLPAAGVAGVIALVALLQLMLALLPRYWRVAHGASAQTPAQIPSGATVGPRTP